MTTATRRPPEPTSDDQFVTSSLKFLNWAKENTRALTLGIVAVAILAAGVFYYVDYRKRVANVASTNLQTLRFELSSGNTSQTVASLIDYVARFGSTRYGTEARVLLAHSLLLENRPAEAIVPASEAARKLGNDPLSTTAAFLLAAAHEQLGDTTAAITVYTDIAAQAELLPEQVRGLETAALLYAARGEPAEAAGLYNRILELLPEESPRRPFYEMKAAEMNVTPLRQAS